MKMVSDGPIFEIINVLISNHLFFSPQINMKSSYKMFIELCYKYLVKYFTLHKHMENDYDNTGALDYFLRNHFKDT